MIQTREEAEALKHLIELLDYIAKIYRGAAGRPLSEHEAEQVRHAKNSATGRLFDLFTYVPRTHSETLPDRRDAP